MSDADKILQLKSVADQSAAFRKTLIEEQGQTLIELSSVMSGVIGSGGKILVAGNGALAGHASGFAAHLMVRGTAERARQSLPVVALSADTSVLTAAAERYGFDNLFTRQIEGLGQKGDMLFVLAVEGDCSNLIRALKLVRERGMISAGLLGNNGGEIGSLVDRPIRIPHPNPRRVEEEQLFLLHMLVELLEHDLFS